MPWSIRYIKGYLFQKTPFHQSRRQSLGYLCESWRSMNLKKWFFKSIIFLHFVAAFNCKSHSSKTQGRDRVNLLPISPYFLIGLNLGEALHCPTSGLFFIDQGTFIPPRSFFISIEILVEPNLA